MAASFSKNGSHVRERWPLPLELKAHLTLSPHVPPPSPPPPPARKQPRLHFCVLPPEGGVGAAWAAWWPLRMGHRGGSEGRHSVRNAGCRSRGSRTQDYPSPLPRVGYLLLSKCPWPLCWATQACAAGCQRTSCIRTGCERRGPAGSPPGVGLGAEGSLSQRPLPRSFSRHLSEFVLSTCPVLLRLFLLLLLYLGSALHK